MHSNNKKIKRLLASMLALAAAGFALYFFVIKDDDAPAVQYETIKVVKGDITSKVLATGTVSALVTVQVGSQVSGRLQKILVDYNSKVKKGQVLAQIDQQMFKAAVDQAKANLLAAQSSLDKANIQAADAERQYKRSRSLLEKNLTSEAEVETAKSSFDMAKAQILAAEGGLAQARAALQQAQINLGYTTIVSPINGIVISRNVDTGQTVAASFQAPTLFTIAEDLSRMQVDTNVSEADVGKLLPDMSATFTVDAYPGEIFTGKVRQIRNAPQVVQNVVTYDAVIDVQNPELKLKPGMTANVNFIHARREGVLLVPNAALRFRPPADTPGFEKRPDVNGKNGLGLQRVIWLLRAGKPLAVKVTAGISDGVSTEIVSTELNPGEEVITGLNGEKNKKKTPFVGGRMPH